MILYRSDKVYGNGGHTPAEILAYETINLGNVWILEDLRLEYNDFLTHEVKSDIDWFLAAVDAGHVTVDDEDIDYSPYVNMFEGLINSIERCKKVKIKHLLWLTEMDNLLELYYNEPCIDYLEDIDAYETGFELIHFEGDGHLFAYNEMPIPLPKPHVKEALDKATGAYCVYVWNGVGYELTPIYFDRCNISIEEIAKYCVLHNVGWVLSEEEYYSEFKNDERFVYVDLSEAELDNIWLCIENIQAGLEVEVYS